MPVIYQLADSDLHSMLNSVMKKYHPRLHEKEVRIDLLLAFSDGGCRAITAGGYPALDKVRIVKLPDRTKGCGDAEIQLDGDQLKEWSRKQTQAILDHELMHLQLKTDKDGYPKMDDLGRPMLKMRKHDRFFGWFDVVANRWGPNSVEGQQLRNLVEDYEVVQMYLPGFDPIVDYGAKNREERNAGQHLF